MLNIKKLFTKILGHVIFEQGTDGIWTYRKYADGTSECWGEITTSTTWTVWTNPIYYGSNYSPNQAFPSGLFIEKPNLQVAVKSSADCWLGFYGVSQFNATYTGRYYPLKIGAQSGETNYTVQFHAIGKWK